MSRTLTILAVAAVCAGGATAAYIAARPSGSAPGADGSAHASDISALRSQVDELKKEVAALRERIASDVATAAATPISREVAQPASPSAPSSKDAAPTAQLSQVDRVAVFALIKEERDLREREREEKRKQATRENITKRLQQVGERVGLDAASTESIVRLYIDNLGREDDIRHAYPISEFGGMDDPNFEKRRQELEAARKDLQARVESMVPEDKRQEWDRRTRMLRRAGDFAEAINGGGPMRGMFEFGGDAAAGFAEGLRGGPGGGQRQEDGGGRGQRRNRDNNNPGGASGAAPVPPAPPKQDN